MPEFIQEIENEYLRIRGQRGFLKPLDWDLAARWEKAGFPLHIILQTMAEVGDRFNRENNGRDRINSLRYFETAVTSAVAKYQANQIGKNVPETEPEISNRATLFDDLCQLANHVREAGNSTGKTVPQFFLIASAIVSICNLEEPSDSFIESRLQELDQELITLLKSISTDDQNAAFESAGTSADPYLKSAQIAAAVRRHYNAPELTIFSDEF